MRTIFSTMTGLAAMAALVAPAHAQQSTTDDVQERFAQSMEADLGRVLDDPDLPEKAGRVTEALVTILDTLPIGQIEAAVEGREPTADDMSRTLGDVADLDGEALGEEVAIAIADNRHRIETGRNAVIATLPHLILAVESLKAELEALERE